VDQGVQVKDNDAMERESIAKVVSDNLAGPLQAIDIRLGSIEKSNAEQSEILKHFGEKLFLGNGAPALATQVALQGQDIKNITERLDNTDGKTFTARLTTWGLILTLIVTIIGEHIATRWDRSKEVSTTTISSTVTKPVTPGTP